MPHTLSIWLLVGAVLSAQAADTRIASIQVRGNVRYTAEEVTRLSGLEIGRAAGAADLTAAANRLASTGLFESVRYSYSTDPSPKMCALQVKGASGIAEADLLDALKGAIGGEYSRNFLTSSARGTLADMYRRKGYWRVAFGPPLALPGACAGAAVTLSVVEGLVYAWDHAEWSGNQALTSDALNKALAMKAGGVADAGKIDVGLRAVAKLYGAQGYLAMRSTMDPRLDDAARTATFAIAIVEGPQFRMGTVSVVGVREADARMLAKKWRLAPGDVYDDSYDDRFHDDVLASLRTSSGGTGHVERQIDVDARTVNVRIVF